MLLIFLLLGVWYFVWFCICVLCGWIWWIVDVCCVGWRWILDVFGSLRIMGVFVVIVWWFLLVGCLLICLKLLVLGFWMIGGSGCWICSGGDDVCVLCFGCIFCVLVCWFWGGIFECLGVWCCLDLSVCCVVWFCCWWWFIWWLVWLLDWLCGGCFCWSWCWLSLLCGG